MFVIAYPHQKNVWLLYDCEDSVEENPNAIYCQGYGYVQKTGDETIRISHEPMSDEELKDLKKEILDYWRGLEESKQSINQ